MFIWVKVLKDYSTPTFDLEPFFMVKYTAKDKFQAVERYLNGKESSYDLAKSMGTDNKAILKWIKQKEFNAIEAFIKPYINYTLEFKMNYD